MTMALGCVLILGGSRVQAREVMVYSGDSISSLGITLQSYGSGTSTENTQNGVIGTRSIQVTTTGLYAGGLISFAKPIEIADPSTIAKDDYLEFIIKFGATTPLGLTYSNRAPTGTGEYLPLPSDAYTGEDLSELPLVPKARHLRVILYSSDGRVVSHTEIICNKPADEQGWYSVSLPLAAFGLTSASKGFPLIRIAVAADYPDTLWIGEIHVVTDDTPIYVESLGDLQPAAGDQMVLMGHAEAGRTPVVFSWDFNAKDGIQQDAVGQVVEVVYKNAGNYKITLTAKDPDGIKKPASTQTEVEVE